MVHFIRPGTPRGDAALAAVAALGEVASERLLRRHQVDGEEILVTRFLMDEKSLEGWLGLADAPDPPGRPGQVETSADPDPLPTAGSPVEGSPAPSPNDAPGEFTRLFRAVEVPDPEPAPAEPPAPAPSSPPQPPAAASPPPDAPPEPTTPQPPVSDGPGEFTRLFQAIRPEDAEQAGDPEAPASPPQAPPAPPRPPASPPPAPPRPPASPPQSASPPSPPGPPAPGTRAPDQPSGGSAPPSTGGSFTQEFGRVVRPGEIPGGDGDAWTAEEGPSPSSPPPPPAVPPRSPPPPPPLRRAEPDFFLGEVDDVKSGGGPREAAGQDADDYLDRLRSAGSPPPPAPPRSAGPPPPRPPSGGAPPPPPPRPGQGAAPQPPGGGGGRAGPSDFTRVISAMDGGASLRRSAPPPPPVPRAPSGMTGMRGAPAGSAGDKRSTLLIVLGMGLVFLVALGVILYFALASGAEADTEGGGDQEGVGEVSGVLLRTAGSGPAIHFAPPSPSAVHRVSGTERVRAG